MKTLLILLAALALVPAALADVPAGFVSHPELAQRVQFIAGKPISVYCATTDDAWTQAQSTYGSTDGAAFASAVGGDAMYLSPASCRPVLQKLAGQSFSWYYLAANLLTLAHESEHLAGHRDEHETDCAALGVLRQVAINFGVRKPLNLGRVQSYAAMMHAAKPPNYSGPC